jgi:2-polyprenyl-6-methoxyphenol hydroxylase-like FAD-dependent oxidoreductase
MAAGDIQTRSCDQWRRCWSANSPEPLRRLLMNPVNLQVDQPVRLSVEVGRAVKWHRPGMLLLGDAAHPMSPIRAQGINMALRDAETTADLLGTVLANPEMAAIDRAIAGVARRRLPEIVAIQQLQQREAERGERLRRSSTLRRLVASSPGWTRPWLAHLWIRQQRILREGLPKNQGGWP